VYRPAGRFPLHRCPSVRARLAAVRTRRGHSTRSRLYKSYDGVYINRTTTILYIIILFETNTSFGFFFSVRTRLISVYRSARTFTNIDELSICVRRSASRWRPAAGEKNSVPSQKSRRGNGNRCSTARVFEVF